MTRPNSFSSNLKLQIGPLIVQVSEGEKEISENPAEDANEKLRELYLKASKILIETGQVKPSELETLNCTIRDKDLDVIFPYQQIRKLFLERKQQKTSSVPKGRSFKSNLNSKKNTYSII